MTEMTEDDKNRSVFFGLQGGDRIMSRKNCNAIKWAQTTLIELELKNQNLSKTVLTLPKSPLLASTDSEEGIHQRRRRERMLDEITLICVRDRIEQLIDAGGEQIEPGATTEQRWGRNSRDTADQICRGIDEFDAE